MTNRVEGRSKRKPKTRANNDATSQLHRSGGGFSCWSAKWKFVCRWWSFWQTQSDAYETAKCVFFFRNVNLHLPKIRTTNRALYRLHTHQPNLPFTDSARDLVNQNCVFGFRVSENLFSSFPLVCNTNLTSTCADDAGTDEKWKCTLETIQSRPEMKTKICAASFPKNEKQILRKMLSLLIHETRSVFRMWKQRKILRFLQILCALKIDFWVL